MKGGNQKGTYHLIPSLILFYILLMMILDIISEELDSDNSKLQKKEMVEEMDALDKNKT